MTRRVDNVPSRIGADEVLVATCDHWWSHWSPRPMVEVEGCGFAETGSSRWRAIAVPQGGLRLTFFCRDFLVPRYATYSVVVQGGEALVYDPGARMLWSRPVVRRLASEPGALPVKVPKVRTGRLTFREFRRGLLQPPSPRMTLPVVEDRG